MNPVAHFEMPAQDRQRMATFYTKAFGWQTKMLGPEMGDYVVVTTTESDVAARRRRERSTAASIRRVTTCPRSTPRS
jgi:predicted enzyme related to lactoylglutathione lyase